MDHDDTPQYRGILGNLGAQPGGLLAGLYPAQPGDDPQRPGGVPVGADPAAISLAAAAGAADLVRTLRDINHQAAIMTAFGKAMGAPGTKGADAPPQGGSAAPFVPADAPDASSSGPVLAQNAPARAAQTAPVDANTVFRRSPVPLPMPRPQVPQWPTPGIFDQRWPRLEVLTADPNALATSVVSDGSARSNPGVITPTRTVGSLIQSAEDKMKHGARSL